MKLWNGERERKSLFIALAFLLPNFLGFLIFTAGPVALSMFMSFTNWNLKPSVELEWIWLRNYVDLFKDPDFWFYLYNTFYFMLGIPLNVIGSLLLANYFVDDMLLKSKPSRVKIALMLAVIGVITCGWLFMFSNNRDLALILGVIYIGGICGVMFGASTYRTMFYIPNFTSGVATIVLWTQVFNPYYGMANNLLKYAYDFLNISYDYLPMWLTSTKSLAGFLPLPAHFNDGGFGLGARDAIIIMGFWMGIGGNNMILYIASIANIPESLYEAAEIDGAGPIRKFWNITVPSVAATTFFIAIMSVIGGLQGGFESAKIMTGGGPAGITTTLAYYIYTAGFEELRLGYASSVAWVLFIIIFVLTMLNWKYGNKQTE